MKKELVKLANHLDKIGHGDLADKLDGILKSAEDIPIDPIPVKDVVKEPVLPASESTVITEGPTTVTTEEIIAEQARHIADSGEAEPLARLEGESDVAYAERTARMAAEAESNAFDDVFAANSAQERINKLADLMSGEFTTYVPGTFSR